MGIVRIFHTAVVGGILVLLVLAMRPMVESFAGRTTTIAMTFALSVTLALTAAVSVSGVAALLWGRHQKMRADALASRNEQLSRDVKELQKRLRHNKIDDSVSR